MAHFEIEMNEMHHCRIVDVKIAGLRGACDVREGGRRALIRCSGARHGRVRRDRLAGCDPPRGSTWWTPVQQDFKATCADGIWPKVGRASLQNLRGCGGGGRLRSRKLEQTA